MFPQKTIEAVQTVLSSAGFNPGTADGLWGPKTRSAYQAWQLKTNRMPTDNLTVADVSYLLSEPAESTVQLVWIAEAQRLLGLKEGAGKLNNPKILDWADNLDVHYPSDDIAWCGLFVAHTMRTALPNEPFPANILGARQWAKFGQQVHPQLGAVGVFWRGSREGWQGHVGYLMGDSGNAYTVLGGNQSDSVSYTSIAKDRLLGAYFPLTAGAPQNLALPAKPQLLLSTNEA